MASGVRTSNACGRKWLGPSGSIKPWSPRTGSWPAPWKPAGEDALKKHARWRRNIIASWRNSRPRSTPRTGANPVARREHRHALARGRDYDSGSEADHPNVSSSGLFLVADKSTENNHVTIVWQGGMSTQHEVARPVGTYTQLKDFRRLSNGSGNSTARVSTSDKSRPD